MIRRYRVDGVDHSYYSHIVEATSEQDAINEAVRLESMRVGGYFESDFEVTPLDAEPERPDTT